MASGMDLIATPERWPPVREKSAIAEGDYRQADGIIAPFGKIFAEVVNLIACTRKRGTCCGR